MDKVFIMILAGGSAILGIWEFFIWKDVSKNDNPQEIEHHRKRFFRRSKMVILLLISLALIMLQEKISSPKLNLLVLMLCLIFMLAVIIMVLKDLKDIGKTAVEQQTKITIDSLKEMEKKLKEIKTAGKDKEGNK